MIDFNKLKEIVKSYLQNEPTGHDYLHALRVCSNAKKIMKVYQVDEDVVLAASLVHDLIDHKLEEKYKCDIEDLKRILDQVGYLQSQIDMIIDIISRMSFSRKESFTYLEGMITQDSDRLDALGAIGIARTFAFGGAHKRNIYDIQLNKETSVGHFYDKLFLLKDLMNTKEAKKIAQNRTKYMKDYIKTLQDEIDFYTFRENGEE